MVGGGERRKPRSWEEDLIYWNRFEFTLFTQILSNNDLHQPLAIPKKITDNAKKKLPENVSFKGPSGYIWNIKVTRKDDTFYFTQGWEEFVKDHSLKEGDAVAFNYEGDSLFKVKIFVRSRGHAHVRPSQNVQQHDNVEQHGGVGGSNSKKRDIDHSAEDVTSDAGVEVARAEQFAADGANNTEPSYVPSQAASKRVKRHDNEQRGTVTDSSGPIDLGPISDPVGTSLGPEARPN